MTTALDPATVNPTNLGALIEAQGENLANTVDQATEIFKENQAKQKETIDCLTTTVDSLQAELIKARGENDQLKKAHEAALKALKDKQTNQEKCLSDEITQAQEICGRVISLQDQSEVCCCFTHVKKHHQPINPNQYWNHTLTESDAIYLRLQETAYMELYKGKEGGALRELTKAQVEHIRARLEIIKKELKK